MRKVTLKNKSQNSFREYESRKAKCGLFFRFKFCNYEMLDQEKSPAETDADKLIRLHEILSIQIDEYQRLINQYELLQLKLFNCCSNHSYSVKQNATFLKKLLNKLLLKEKEFHKKKNYLCEQLKYFFLYEKFFEW